MAFAAKGHRTLGNSMCGSCSHFSPIQNHDARLQVVSVNIACIKCTRRWYLVEKWPFYLLIVISWRPS